MVSLLLISLALSAEPPGPTFQCSSNTPDLEFPTWEETEEQVKVALWAGQPPIIMHNSGRYRWSDQACVLGRAAYVHYGFDTSEHLARLWIVYGINGLTPAPSTEDIRVIRTALEKRLGKPQRVADASGTTWSWKTSEVEATLVLGRLRGEPPSLQLVLSNPH